MEPVSLVFGSFVFHGNRSYDGWVFYLPSALPGSLGRFGPLARKFDFLQVNTVVAFSFKCIQTIEKLYYCL